MKVENKHGEFIGQVVNFVAVSHQILAVIVRDNGELVSEPIERIKVLEAQKEGSDGTVKQPIGVGGSADKLSNAGADGRSSAVPKVKKGRA